MFILLLLCARSDFDVLPELGARNITMNVCGPVVGETWKLDDPESVAGYFRGPHSDISIGCAIFTSHYKAIKKLILL